MNLLLLLLSPMAQSEHGVTAVVDNDFIDIFPAA
jgi:hypothetical protein